MIKVKVQIFCQCCDASVETLASLEEERGESSCGCCSGRGTGRFFIDAEVYDLPQGWTKHRRYDIDYYCPEHKHEE